MSHQAPCQIITEKQSLITPPSIKLLLGAPQSIHCPNFASCAQGSYLKCPATITIISIFFCSVLTISIYCRFLHSGPKGTCISVLTKPFRLVRPLTPCPHHLLHADERYGTNSRRLQASNLVYIPPKLRLSINKSTSISNLRTRTYLN